MKVDYYTHVKQAIADAYRSGDVNKLTVSDVDKMDAAIKGAGQRVGYTKLKTELQKAVDDIAKVNGMKDRNIRWFNEGNDPDDVQVIDLGNGTKLYGFVE